MDVREKLVELLSYFADGYYVENRHIAGEQKVCEIADHLIAHGVTVQQEALLYWKPVKPGEWHLTCSACDSHLVCKENARFCPECGAKFVCPEAVMLQPTNGE